MDEQKKRITRRDVLIAGAGASVVGVGAVAALSNGKFLAHAQNAVVNTSASGGSLPVNEIEEIMENTGTVSNGVLTIELDRTDLHVIFSHWAMGEQFSMQR